MGVTMLERTTKIVHFKSIGRSERDRFFQFVHLFLSVCHRGSYKTNKWIFLRAHPCLVHSVQLHVGLERYGGRWRAAPITTRTASTLRGQSLRASVTCSRVPTGKVAAGARLFFVLINIGSVLGEGGRWFLFPLCECVLVHF